MYVSSWPGLTLREVLPSNTKRHLPYPLSAKRQSAFCVARSGIFHLFRALRLQPGEVVLVPDYHSGNEVAAMKAAGASIVYYPIRRNLEPDMDALYELAKAGPRVIYVIHYLGWPQPIEEMQALCRKHGSILVEDCALSLLSEHGGRALGSFGDYSVFCLYKTLPVPNGGLLVENSTALPELAGLELEACPRSATVGRSLELGLESVRSRADRVGKALFEIKQAAGRMMRANGVRHVPVGDIGWDMANVKIAMSPLSDSISSKLDYDNIRRQRRENYQRLRQWLNGGVSLVREDLPNGTCPLFFPILVRDKSAAARELWKCGIGAVEFWSDPQPYVGADAQYLRSHVLELPIHQGVSPEQVEYIASQVQRLKLEPAPC